MKKKRKFMNQWVILDFNGVIKEAKIVNIEFHQELKTPVFDLVSRLGNPFRLTRDELKMYESSY